MATPFSIHVISEAKQCWPWLVFEWETILVYYYQFHSIFAEKYWELDVLLRLYHSNYYYYGLWQSWVCLLFPFLLSK